MRAAVFGALLVCGIAQGAEPKIVTNSIGMELISIPAGKFTMGEDGGSVLGDKASVAVTLTRPFWLGKTEVTQCQWKAVMGTKPWIDSGGKSDADLPATNVSWDDATEFCKKLTQLERGSGKLPVNEEYRLPTEAEWEYACRAGTTTIYSFGDVESGLGDFAWFGGNSGQAVHKVGTKQANPWGLYDMHGNVREWCADWYRNKPSGGSDPIGVRGASKRLGSPSPRGGPGGPSSCVGRGGSCEGLPVDCRSADRNGIIPSYRYPSVGFRVARGHSVR